MYNLKKSIGTHGVDSFETVHSVVRGLWGVSDQFVSHKNSANTFLKNCTRDSTLMYNLAKGFNFGCHMSDH